MLGSSKHVQPIGRRFALATISRFVAVIGGGFVFTYGLVAIGTLMGFAAGLRFFEAQTLAWMLSFPVFLGAILWGSAAKTGSRVLLVLAGGGSLLCALSYALSRAML